MAELEELQKKIRSLADTVNAFKSEAVQLRVVDVLLSQLGIVEEPSPGQLSRSTKKSRSRKRASPSQPGKATNKVKRTRAGSTSVGAHAAITNLLGDGFFKSGKTISNIVEHCRNSKGQHYKASQCSPTLLRLLRDGNLQRKKNKDGQYEYTQT